MEILEKINVDVNEVLRQPEVARAFSDVTGVVMGGSREAMSTYLREESGRWSAVIKSAGIKIQ